jgi:hypothetical protein
MLLLQRKRSKEKNEQLKGREFPERQKWLMENKFWIP